MPEESKRSWTLEKIEFLVRQILDYIDDQKTTIDSALDSSSTNPVQNSAIVTALNNKVTGPSTAVNSQVAIFDGTTGKLIKDSGFTIGKSIPSDAKFSDTNTKVTSVGNHYTPVTNAASELTANAANGTAAWSTDVVTGITISRDAKGHVTDVSVASGKIPAQPTIPSAASSSPGKVASSSAVGTATNYARQDHTHGIDLATGDNNGEIKIAGTNVAVKGLGSNAYTSTAYAPIANPIFTGTVSMETSGIGHVQIQHVFEDGTGTVGHDAGSGNSPRYFPSTWIFDGNVELINGTKMLIRVPIAGFSAGVYLSMDGGNTFAPVMYGDNDRLQTQFPVGTLLQLIYDSEGVVPVYSLEGSDATIEITGVWRAMNMYNTNTTYSAMSTAEVTAGTASSARTMQARYLSAGLKAAITKGSNAVPGQFTVYGQIVDTLGATASNNGKFLSIANGSPAWVASPTQDLSAYAPKASPVFTGGITIGSTLLTEAKLQSLLSLLAGGLNGTTWLLNAILTAPSQTITVTNSSGLFYFGGNSYNNTNYTIAVDDYHDAARLKYYDDFGDSTMYEADQWMDQSCRTITFIADIDTASPSVQAFIDWLNANATRQ